MVVLRNKTRQPLVYNLDHEFACSEDECLCSVHEHRSRGLNPETGEVGVRHIEKTVCAAIHLLPGIPSQPLPDSVLTVPAIAADLKARRLVKE